ncbi:MAG: sugar kinase [Kouleothrix sp.]|jgi:fructokinase/2-dehydro-3-deoxygluconokinase|nr:sugar kinase [Kouleothrix sp.]
MGHVLVVGDANVDLVIHLPGAAAPPHQGELQARIVGGGTGANTAVALARLGVPVSFAGTIGHDRYGRWIAEDFEHEHVDTRGLVVRAEAFTPTVVIVVGADGERHAVLWPPEGWAHTLLHPTDLPSALIAEAGWLHTTGMCLRAMPVRTAMLHAMRVARAAGVPVSLDLNLRLELWGWDDDVRQAIRQAVELADVVLGNAREEIVPLAECDDLVAAAQALCDRQRIVVARLGAEGALAVAPGQVVRAPAFPAAVVNTVGAGDAFDGGFIAARLAGRPLGDALRWGNAVAALKIQGDSARALPSRAEVEALLASRPR